MAVSSLLDTREGQDLWNISYYWGGGGGGGGEFGQI